MSSVSISEQTPPKKEIHYLKVFLKKQSSKPLLFFFSLGDLEAKVFGIQTCCHTQLLLPPYSRCAGIRTSRKPEPETSTGPSFFLMLVQRDSRRKQNQQRFSEKRPFQKMILRSANGALLLFFWI